MKDDTIYRHAALSALSGCTEIYLNNLPPTIYKTDAVGAIKSLPPLQSEIIRCKDCKHIQKWRSEESAKKFGQIYECERNMLNFPKPEDFCSHAERRTDG